MLRQSRPQVQRPLRDAAGEREDDQEKIIDVHLIIPVNDRAHPVAVRRT